MKKHLLLLLLTLLPMVASADDSGSCGDNVTWTFNETVQTLTFSGSGEIPGVRKWFKYESSIKRIIIEEGITSIGNNAFVNCKTFSIIDIPNSVTSIGENAFQGCSGLVSLVFHCNEIFSCFWGLESLKEVTIGEEVMIIDHGAFAGCSSLTSITILSGDIFVVGEAFEGTAWYNNQSDGLVYVGNILYKYKGAMPKNTSIEIKSGTTSIAGYAFANCSNLSSVIIPNSVSSIGPIAFYGCSSLSSITIPNSVTSIGNSAFQKCSGLSSITIGNNVTNIDDCAFYECTNITSVHISDIEAWCKINFCNDYFDRKTSSANPLYYAKHLFLNGEELKDVMIPNSIKEIGTFTFQYCTGLTSVTIPKSIEIIKNNAFYNCENLMTVRSDLTEPFNCDNLFNENTYRKGTLYVPAGTKDLYARFDGWREFLRIEEVGGEPQKFQLSFVVNNKELSKQETKVGATITPPAKDNNGNTISWYTYPETMPAHDLMIYGMTVIQPEPEVYVWLTVKDGQSGTTKIEVKQGTEQRLNINPEEGWKLSAIMMDNDDVTAQLQSDGTFVTPALMSDATLTIVYEQETPSGVRTMTQSKADVKMVTDGVVISNAEPDTRCVVYQTDGKQVVNAVINEGTRKITLQKGQAYILTIDGRTLKFAL